MGRAGHGTEFSLGGHHRHMLVASPAVDENLRPGRHTRIANGTTHEDPMHLQGSCRCGAVGFSCDVYAPMPFLRCYCSICSTTAGGGGCAVHLGAWADSLKVEEFGRGLGGERSCK